MLNRNEYQGFTILEMLLVLSISCLLVLLPILQIRAWEERLSIAYFFHEFERQLIGMQQEAIVGRRTVAIRVSQNGEAVFYYQQTNQGSEIESHIVIPEKIRSQKTTEIKFIAKTGNLSKIDRFEFMDNFSNQRIVYQYQIGSGRFVKKVSEL